MRRVEWLSAGVLIVLGLCCLTMAGVGYSMGALMSWLPIYGICLVGAIVVATFVGMFIMRIRKSSLRCAVCNHNLQQEWHVCPHCGTPIQSQ